MMVINFLADVVWADAWARTGMGFGVVFSVLLILVFVLVAFGLFSRAGKKKAQTPQPAPLKAAAPQTVAPAASASDADKAAIATALYLYFQNVHDEESNVITIRHNASSAWHHELNPRYNSVK
ncbi:MAG: OadG family protein [Bacteroidaceae bacterium]|nr:OadG family protein [Bacteroidaceae bacterium]